MQYSTRNQPSPTTLTTQPSASLTARDLVIRVAASVLGQLLVKGILIVWTAFSTA